MEAGAQSNGIGEKKNETETSKSLTEATMARIFQRTRKRLNPGTRRYYRDNKAQGYEWLLPGWVAEERHMESGRVYRYYYDPNGNLYYTQNEVINAWEQAGLVVIDN